MNNKAFGYKLSRSHKACLNVEEYYPFFPKRIFDLEKNNTRRIKKGRENTITYDKLFFNILVMINECDFIKYTKNYEVNKKYKMIEKIQDCGKKIKQLDKIVNYMQSDQDVNIRVLDCVSIVYDINIFVYDSNIYYERKNNNSDMIFMIDDTFNIVEKRMDVSESMKQSRYKLDCVIKPLYSMSHYKVNDLHDIIQQLGISMVEDKPKKADLYKMIEERIKNSVFNSD